MSKQDIHVEKQLAQEAKPKRPVKDMEWDFEVGDVPIHVDPARSKKHEGIELPVNWEDMPLP